MALKLKWPYKYKVVGTSRNGHFGRLGKFDYYIKKGKRIPLPHQGQDFPIPCGTPFSSPVKGKVDILEKNNFGYGYFVRIKFGVYHIGFAHNSRLDVRLGQTIKVGQLLGLTGATGSGTACHSHLELKIHEKVVNPETMIKWVVQPMADPWYIKDINSKKIEIANLKKVVKSKATEISNLKKSITNNYVTKVNYEKALKDSQLACDRISEQRLANHVRETEILLVDIATLKIKVDGLKAEITTFKEPKGPKIPRVTKFDNIWSKWWKRFLQVIAR